MATRMDNELDNQVRMNEVNLDRVIAWSRTVDQKAAFVLTLTLVMLGYLTSQLSEFFNAVFLKWRASPSGPAVFIVLIVVLAAALVGLVAAMINLVSVVRPRLIPPSAKRSLLFFQTIASMPCEEFSAQLNAMDQQSYMKALSDQTHDVAKVVTEKFKRLSNSIKWFWLGVAAVGLFSFLRPLLVKLLPG